MNRAQCAKHLSQTIAFQQIQDLLPKEKSLFLFAHPDDETLFSGTILHLGREEEVYTYYATLGEQGMTNGLCSQEDLATIRFHELQEANKTLRVPNMIVPKPDQLHLHDGKLPEEFDRLVQDIQEKLHAIKPDRILTFPPSGITGHADHQTILLAGWKATHQYIQQTERSIEFLCRVIPLGARGIEGAEKHSGLIKHDKHLPITHSVKVSSFAPQIKRVLRAHQTQQPALSTIYPVLRNDKQPTHRSEYYSRVLVRE